MEKNLFERILFGFCVYSMVVYISIGMCMNWIIQKCFGQNDARSNSFGHQVIVFSSIFAMWPCLLYNWLTNKDIIN